MNTRKRYLIIILFISGLFSCEREIDFVLPGPQILLLSNEVNSVVLEPGQPILLEFEIQAASFLDEFVVTLNDEIYDQVAFLNEEISSQYSIEFLIPEDAQTDFIYNFEFNLTDKRSQQSQFNFRIRVGSTFEEEVVTFDNGEYIRVKGRINGNYSFEAGNIYMIDSVFSIEDSGVLTIEAGTTIYFKTDPSPDYISRLVIARGSRIIAEGTREQPIVFTSDKVLFGDDPSPNDWGGVFIYGNAPTNQGAQVQESGFRYGGTQLSDNSGTMRFVRIEYAGKQGLHGIHLFGVGSATTLEYIQIYKNENISFRVKGGGVNLKYIAAIGHGGYGIWAEHGWRGNGQFWIFQTDRQATLIPLNFWNQARSLEMRSDENFFLTAPRTRFNIANVTMIGNGNEANNGTRRGLRIRRGAFGVLQNVIVTEFPDDGARVEDLAISELGNVMIMDNLRVFNNRVNFEQDAASFFFASGNYNITEQAVPGISKTNFVGSVSSPFNPQTLGNWFSSAPYIGAVENEANDWTKGGRWFKNLDGSLRE